MATADPPRVARPGGFTLIEIMVAMVITGILSVVIFQFVIGQDRFAQTQSAREEVQQNARVASEIISSELRATAPAGLDEFEEDRIVFESARVFGVVCAPPTGSGVVMTTSSEVTVEALHDRFGLKVQDPNGWNYASENKNHRILVAEGTLDDCDDSLYTDDEYRDTHGDDLRVLRLTRSSGNPLPGGDYVVGESLVVLYDRLSYFVDEDADVHWIYRQRLGNARQPLAGPVAADGLRFEYRDIDDQVVSPVSGDADAVREIRISVVAQSQRRPSEVERKNASVFLRQ